MSESTGVAFQQIPANNVAPLFFVEFNNTLAGTVGQTVQPSLAIGQTIEAQPLVPVYIPSPQFAMNLFGPNSMLARMCAVYFKSDSQGPLYALPLADAENATAATGSIEFTQAATGSGTIYLYVGGQLVSFNVATGDTPAVMGGNLADAINASVGLCVTAAAVDGLVTLTASFAGTQGNNITLALNVKGAVGGQVLPAGVALTVTPLAGGAGDPDLGQVGDAIGDTIYDFIFHPYAESTQIGEMTAIMSDNDGRWAWDSQAYGHVFTSLPGTVSSLLTLAGTLNDQHGSIFGATGYYNPPYDLVADVVGDIAVSIRNQASQPLQSVQLNTCLAAPAADWNTLSEENTLLAAGISVFRSDQYGNVTIGQAVTTYKTNAYGQPDTSYRYVTSLFTLMAITRQLKSALVTKFGRSILVPNGTVVGPNVPAVSPNIIKAEIVAQYQDMQTAGLVVDAAAMAAATSVQINASNANRVDIIWRPDLANGLTMLAVINQFIINPALSA